MLTEVEFYYLRHGETDWNLRGLAQGRSDVPLNENGRVQAREACALIGQLEIATLCSSPLQRALETAEILQTQCGARLEVVEDLAECSWGAREGQAKGDWFQGWKSGEVNPTGAEPYDFFLKRALRGINQALTLPGPVMIVAHGGVYWAIEKYAALEAGSDLPNATPVFHKPPRGDFPWWRAEVLRATGWSELGTEVPTS